MRLHGWCPGCWATRNRPRRKALPAACWNIRNIRVRAFFAALKCPGVLLNGNHAQIVKWRREQALRVTFERRPEMLQSVPLTAQERALVRGWEKEWDEP